MGKTSKNPSKQDNHLKKGLKQARERYEVVEVPYEMLEFWNTTLKYDPDCVDYTYNTIANVDAEKMYY